MDFWYADRKVKFDRNSLHKDTVICFEGSDVPCHRTNKDYAYDYWDPKGDFIRFVEKTISHHLQASSTCHGAHAQDIRRLLQQIPKKVNGTLERRYRARGYGLRAITGVAFWRVLVALLVSQLPCWVFAILWLVRHPGDLQNAFMPAVYVAAILNLVVWYWDRKMLSQG
jgi:hypothetical protein